MPDQATELLTGPPIRAEIAGNIVTVIQSGEDRQRAILDLIASSRNSLKLLFYMFNPDHVGEKVRDSLVDAATRGVAVRLLIDGFGSATPPDFFNQLAQAAGEY